MPKTTYLTQDDVECCIRFSAMEVKEFYSLFLNQNQSSPYAALMQGFHLDQHPRLKDVVLHVTADRTQLFVDNLIKNGEGDEAHIHPVRMEVRASQGISGASQIAVRGVYGNFRSITLARFNQNDDIRARDLSIKMSGRMSFEINVCGVDKALPLHYLTKYWKFVCEQMGYQPGNIINAFETPMLIAADADGTTYGFPTTKGLPRLEESAAFDAICKYLTSGGIYMIVSGNRMSRTLKRVVDSVPRDLRNRVIITANGASDMAVVQGDGQFMCLDHYREHALDVLEKSIKPVALNTLYLGDDGHVDGNDYAAYDAVGLERCIVVCEQNKADDTLKPQCVGGHEHGTAKIIDKINQDITASQGTLTLSSEYVKKVIADVS